MQVSTRRHLSLWFRGPLVPVVSSWPDFILSPLDRRAIRVRCHTGQGRAAIIPDSKIIHFNSAPILWFWRPHCEEALRY